MRALQDGQQLLALLPSGFVSLSLCICPDRLWVSSPWWVWPKPPWSRSNAETTFPNLASIMFLMVIAHSFFLNGKTAGSRPQSHITVSCVQFGIARGRMSTGSRLLKLEWFCFLVCSSWKRFLVCTAQTQGPLIKLSDAAELVPVPPTPTDTDRVFQWRKITQSQT